MRNVGLGFVVLVGTVCLGFPGAGLAQPSPGGAPSADISTDINDGLSEDIPEEILRTEIITDARSPLTGEPLTAAEYAQLTAELEAPAGDPLVSQNIEYLVFLLQIRRALKPILPFIK